MSSIFNQTKGLGRGLGQEGLGQAGSCQERCCEVMVMVRKVVVERVMSKKYQAKVALEPCVGLKGREGRGEGGASGESPSRNGLGEHYRRQKVLI